MKSRFSVVAASVALMLVQPVSAANLGVSLSPETALTERGEGELLVSVEQFPLLGAIPRGATSVEMATLNMSASCNADITIYSVTVKHIGLGDATDIASVYLESGDRRVSRGRTFDPRSQTADLRVTSLTIRKCEAVRVRVLVSIAPDAAVGSEHGVTIDHASAILSTAKSTTLMTADSSKRIFTSPQSTGTITVNFLPIRGPLRYGRRETVARLQLSADTKNDHLLQSITFKNLGSARDMNLIDFALESTRGEVLTPLAQRMRGRTVTLNFDPTYILERGDTVVFLLKAQINGSRSRTVNFSIEEPSDVRSILYRPSR